jgi:hypothetical protein
LGNGTIHDRNSIPRLLIVSECRFKSIYMSSLVASPLTASQNLNQSSLVFIAD